jgi:hypothetical protein
MQKAVTLQQVEHACDPRAQTLCAVLTMCELLNPDCAFTIATAGASGLGPKITPKQVLELVASDLLARAYKSDPEAISRLLNS